MDKHNRKSYLAPPAPKSLNRDGSRNSGVAPRPPSATSGTSHPPSHPTPTSGDIPLNIASDAPANVYTAPSPVPNPMKSARSALEHLSLETRDSHGSQTGRSSRPYRGDPVITADPPSRPALGSRSASSHSSSAVSGLHTAMLPTRAAQNASFPVPLASTGASLRDHAGRARGEHAA